MTTAEAEITCDTVADFLEAHSEWKDYPDLVISPPSRDELVDMYPELDFSFLDHAEEFVCHGVTRGAIYARMRMTGSVHKFAEMVALQRGPVLSTDDTFFQGSKPLYDQFGSQKHLNKYLKISKAHGFVPDKNAVYFAPLARFPGDPEAYVTRAQGRSYIRKVCERRGWACEGGVNVKGREPESDPLDHSKCKPLGEDIIRQRASQMIQADPSLKAMDRRELREKIIDKHGAKP